jgi:glycosyltransferase involved in cell wall biosynthesis
MKPTISVLMSCYNESDKVGSAVESVLSQTFRDFEFLIVDDESSDDTLSILQAYAEKDSRIRVYSNEKNIGLAASLNKLVGLSRGELIARMDGDDISLPTRFELQVALLREDTGIDVVGTSIELQDASGHISGEIIMPEHHHELYRARYYRTIVVHPSVLARRSFFYRYGLYSEDLLRAQDLDLWIRAINRGAKFHNLQEKLLIYTKPEKATSLGFWSAIKAKWRNQIKSYDVLIWWPILLIDICRYVLLVKKK